MTRDGKNNISLGTECSLLINWRDKSEDILENANSYPVQNLNWFNVYHPCLERRRKRDLGSGLCCQYLIRSFFYSLFIGLLRCARHCESNELESDLTSSSSHGAPRPEQVPFFMH